MTRRLVLAVAALLAGVSGSSPRLVHAMPATAINTVIEVAPFEGHSGDTFYVSGSGYRPLTQITFLVACPRYDDYHAGEYGNIQIEPGPTTNAAGDFAGFPISGFQLHRLQQSPCVIYPNYQNQIFVADSPAVYYIVPQNQGLKKAHLIHGIVRALPRRVRAGLEENIAISNGWGGAMASVTVYYPHRKPHTVHVRLNWRGEQHVRVLVDAASPRPSLARVHVHFQLGSGHGDSSASFTVVG